MRAEPEARPQIADVDASKGAPRPTSTSTQQRPSPPKLVIAFDEPSQRFVQMLVDETAHTILRRYPNEGQLAFSRGVNAYERAMRRNRF